MTGLVAQGFTLLASLLPVMFGRVDTLVTIVTLSAVSAILLAGASLAANQLIPVEVDTRATLERIGASTYWVLAAGVVIALAASGIAQLTTGDWVNGASLGLLTASNAAFIVVLAVLVWRKDFRGVMTTRLVYGVGAATLTLMACVADAPAAAYLCALALAYVFAVAAVVRRHLRLWSAGLSAIRLARPDRRIEIVTRSTALVGALTTSAAASQAGALATPLLGPLSGAWAIVVRIMGGFQTLGAQIIGVSIDIRLASAVRSRDRQRTGRIVWTSSLLALCTGLTGGVIAVLCAGLLVDVPPPSILFDVGAACFAAGQIALSPIGRSLGFIGPHWVRLIWEIVRLAATVAALICFKDLSLILALAALSVLSFASYWALTAMFVRRMSWASVQSEPEK